MIRFQQTYTSPIGPLMLVATASGLTGACFMGRGNVRMELAEAPKEQPRQILILDKACTWLDAYFSGENPSLDALPLDLSATAFQRKVWEVLAQIPYGKTMTYGDIAKQINCRSAQAVGGAIGKNPLAIFIPCHRVLGADNRLTGYAWGLERKAWLLEHERMEKK